MKRKYHGVTTIGVLFVSCLIIIGYGAYLGMDIETIVRTSKLTPLPDLSLPEQSVLNRMKTLDRILPSLATLSTDQAPVTLRIFGYKPSEDLQTKSTQPKINTGQYNDHFLSYKLSFCYSTPKKSYCVINGKLYAKNSSLPGNEKIIRIEHDRIQIQDADQKKWIYLIPKKEKIPKEEKIMSQRETS